MGSRNLVRRRLLICCLLCFVGLRKVSQANPLYLSHEERLEMKQKVKRMFYHGYDGYMTYAFPHDELKPMSGTFTDSLAELGNAAGTKTTEYSGVALTLIDTLDTLAVLGNKTEFSQGVKWVTEHVSFDHDIRVHVFECNIRLLGGLLSAHMLASDKDLALIEGFEYKDGLLSLAYDLGKRLLRAFTDSPSEIPYAWVNLRSGVNRHETKETCTAGVGTLLVEFSVLSHLTKDKRFLLAAHKALLKLWSLRSRLGLLGNTLDASSGSWINSNAGIGAGVDSFYEYLFKTYALFGHSDYWDMFMTSYQAVMKYLKRGPWYFEASMHSGNPSHLQFNSLQAFWPGLQVLAGIDVDDAISTHDAMYHIWKKYGALPERFLLQSSTIHSTERYYPLRPEFIESTYYLYKATNNPYYLKVAADVYNSLERITRTEYGYASVRNVETSELEDRMTSFFLAETCKYLFLMFDEDNFVHHANRTYVFSTEGHMFRSTPKMQKFVSNLLGKVKEPATAPATLVCKKRKWPRWAATCPGDMKAIPPFTSTAQPQCGVRPPQPDKHQCASSPKSNRVMQDFQVDVGEGSFHLVYKDHEYLDIRNLGTGYLEVSNGKGDHVSVNVMHEHKGVIGFAARLLIVPPTGVSISQDLVDECAFPARVAGGFFGPLIEVADDAVLVKQTKQSALYRALENQFNELADFHMSRVVAGELVEADPADGCSPHVGGSAAVRGKVVLAIRGECTFMQKVLTYEKLGASAVVVGNLVADNQLFMMGSDGTEREVAISSYMMTKTETLHAQRCLQKARDSGASMAIALMENVERPIQRSLPARKKKVTGLLEGEKNHFRYTTHGGYVAFTPE